MPQTSSQRPPRAAPPVLPVKALLFVAIGLCAPVPELPGQVTPGCSRADFGEPLPAILGSNPVRLALGDFNGDGLFDLAATLSSSQSIAVALASPSGTYSAPLTIPLGVRPLALIAFDADGDGRLDLACTDEANGSWSLLIGDGLGGFSLIATMPTGGQSPRSIAAGDIDQNGTMDVVVANANSGTIALYSRQANGTYQPALFPALGPRPEQIRLGDVNADGRPDVLVADWMSDSVSVLFSDPTRGLVPGGTFAAGTDPLDMSVGDFNGDQSLDVATANEAGQCTLLYGDGNGGFIAGLSYETGSGSQKIAAADFNSDGFLDIAVMNRNSADVTVLWGDGRGAFPRRQNYGTGTGAQDLSLGDRNLDGLIDIVVLPSPGNAAIFLDQEPSGRFGSRRHLAIAEGATDLIAEDLNGDSYPDLIVLESLTDSLRLFFSDGTGGYLPPQTLGIMPGSRAMSYGRVFGGSLAITVANQQSLQVFPNLGNGSFGNPLFQSIGANLTSLTQADFDRDGIVDYAIADAGRAFGSNPLPAAVHILRGVGSRLSLFSAQAPDSLQSPDLNGDGFPDLIWADSGLLAVAIQLGDGAGGFQPLTTVMPGIFPLRVKALDLNRDGRLDLAVIASGSGTGVFVSIGIGNGSFLAPILVPMPELPTDFVTGDFNADGLEDFCVTTHGFFRRSLFILQPSANGGVTTVEVPMGDHQDLLQAADLDRDGDSDLIVATRASNGPNQRVLALLENRCAALSVEIRQPGAGLPLELFNFHLDPSLEAFNLLNTEVCPGPPGTGPAATLGLCIQSPAQLANLTAQLLSPLGAIPFHFLPSGTRARFGPYSTVGLAGLELEMVGLQWSGTGQARVSAVRRYLIR